MPEAREISTFGNDHQRNDRPYARKRPQMAVVISFLEVVLGQSLQFTPLL